MSGKNLFWYMSGLGNTESIMFRIYISDEFLILDNVKPHAFLSDTVIQQYKLKASDIVAFDIVKTSELKKGSVLGRGAAGGILFGPVGAVLGGMSAMSGQKVKSTLAICYLPSSGNEPKTIVFNAEPVSWGGQNAASISKMKKQLSKIPRSDRVKAYLGQTVNEDGSITL